LIRDDPHGIADLALQCLEHLHGVDVLGHHHGRLTRHLVETRGEEGR
jgi:hypothetical protein